MWQLAPVSLHVYRLGLNGEFCHDSASERTRNEFQKPSYKLPCIINQDVEHELLSPREKKEEWTRLLSGCECGSLRSFSFSWNIPHTQTTDEVWQAMKCLSSVLHLDSVQQHMPDKVHLVNTPVVRLILVENSTLHFLHFYFKFYI